MMKITKPRGEMSDDIRFFDANGKKLGKRASREIWDREFRGRVMGLRTVCGMPLNDVARAEDEEARKLEEDA